jgi:hypothetical protein
MIPPDKQIDSSAAHSLSNVLWKIFQNNLWTGMHRFSLPYVWTAMLAFAGALGARDKEDSMAKIDPSNNPAVKAIRLRLQAEAAKAASARTPAQQAWMDTMRRIVVDGSKEPLPGPMPSNEGE